MFVLLHQAIGYVLSNIYTLYYYQVNRISLHFHFLSNCHFGPHVLNRVHVCSFTKPVHEVKVDLPLKPSPDSVNWALVFNKINGPRRERIIPFSERWQETLLSCSEPTSYFENISRSMLTHPPEHI